MAYRIVYGVDQHRKSRLKKLKIIPTMAILIALIMIFRASRMDETILNFLIPGDPEFTEASVLSMIESLQSGATVKEAFSVFCREIIEHAKVY